MPLPPAIGAPASVPAALLAELIGLGPPVVVLAAAAFARARPLDLGDWRRLWALGRPPWNPERRC
eukprot:3588373-Pyramimonas_sp.AAC.1